MGKKIQIKFAILFISNWQLLYKIEIFCVGLFINNANKTILNLVY